MPKPKAQEHLAIKANIAYRVDLHAYATCKIGAGIPILNRSNRRVYDDLNWCYSRWILTRTQTICMNFLNIRPLYS